MAACCTVHTPDVSSERVWGMQMHANALESAAPLGGRATCFDPPRRGLTDTMYTCSEDVRWR